MSRKLASIQRVRKLLPIEGADKIEKAIINSWPVVVQKGLHNEGNLKDISFKAISNKWLLGNYD